jgi:hypothetical protein
MHTRLFPGLLAVLILLPGRTESQCSAEDRFRGRVLSVDLAAGLFEAENNVLPGTRIFGVDGNTDFVGSAASLAQLAAGMDVDLRFCLSTNPLLVLRMDSTPAPTPRAGTLVIDLADAPGTEEVAVERVFGDDASEALGGQAGQGTVLGDLNGDGFADLVTRGGRSPIDTSDAIVIVYGGPDAPGALVDLDTDGVVSPAGETRLVPAVPFQALGPLACGDVNADGLDDVVIGQSTGVQVVFGARDLPGRVIVIDPGSVAPGQFRIQTDQAPATVATCDLNADGHDDVVVDARTQGLFVVYGGPALGGTTRNLVGATGAVSGTTHILTTHPVSSLASGELNGDGFEDLVIGQRRTISLTFPCAVVVYGADARVGALIDLANNPTVSIPRETRITGHSLAAVACADFDGDGFDDLMLATPDVLGPGDNFAVGEVNVIRGAANLPGRSLDLTGAVLPNETRLTGREEFGEFGKSVAAADVDGDGRADLIMGAPGAVPYGTLPELNTRSDGALYALRGRAGQAGIGLIDPREVADLFVFAAARNDRLGSTVAAGADVDRDGLPDVVLTSPAGSNPSLGGSNFAGYAAVPFLRVTTPPPTTITRRATRAGDGPGGAVVPPTDFGPVARVTIDFSDDDAATGRWTSAMLVRSGLPGTADVGWIINTERAGWDGATVTFRYTDAEVAGMAKGRLAVMRANTPAGPFSLVPSFPDARRNAVTAHVDRLGTFVLVEVPRIKGAGRPTRFR